MNAYCIGRLAIYFEDIKTSFKVTRVALFAFIAACFVFVRRRSTTQHQISITMASSGDRVERLTFSCQKCNEPLKIHSSFATFDPSSLLEVVPPGNEAEGLSIRLEEAVVPVKPVYLREGNGHPKMSDSEGNGNGGFLIIGDNGSQGNHGSSEKQTKNGSPVSQTKLPVTSKDNQDINHKLTVTARLFDLLSSDSDIKHPLCEECADFIIDQMDTKLRSIEEECKIYKEFEEALKSQEATDTEKEIEELEEKMKDLQTEEQELLKQLQEVDEEQKAVQAQLEEQNKQLLEIDQQEAVYWNQYNNLKLQFFKGEDELQSLSNQIRYRNHHLDKLKKTNLLNITFHIWHCGHFGTINGFRLGRLPTVAVEWSEINAAFGQCALLLHCLAKKINLTFERYRLVPYGNYSFLESLADPSKQLPLYGQGGFRFTWSTKFDNAIMAFLDCLQQFKQEVEKMDNNFRLPYRMTDKGKIEDTKIQGNSYSMKIQFNSEEQWTKAMKYMLTNLKWILAWIATRDAA